MSYVSGRVVDPQWVGELALRSRLSANFLDQILSERKFSWRIRTRLSTLFVDINHLLYNQSSSKNHKRRRKVKSIVHTRDAG